LESPHLHESTIKDICDELAKRSLNFIMIANYYDGCESDQSPVMSFGVRKQDLAQAIGMLETSKAYLIKEFSEDNEIEYPEDEEDSEV
jgi:hypothetical protein